MPLSRSLLRLISLGACLAIAATGLHAQAAATLVIDATAPTGKVSPLHYGLMTEEINYCYDGGLYAELLRNRAFLDDAKNPVHWTPLSNAVIALDPSQPLNAAIGTSLRIEASAAGAGVANTGYWGIPVKPQTTYHASFYAKGAPGFSGPVTLAIQSTDGATVYAQAQVLHLTADWQAYEVSLSTDLNVTPTTKARLALTVQQPGTVWLGLVSLFPPTWKDRPNGLRPDLMQMLVDLKPAFLRFPGGNYLEGDTIETRFDWKKTLGPINGRTGHPGPWGYRSTDGMGLLEFLLWCEDMNAEPVLALYAGYSLKGIHVKPGADLEPYVQDAFDEIEYVTGPASSKWGAQRAKDGHPEPFKLRYVEIGNEDWFDKSGSYNARFTQFHVALEKRYPHLKCISSVGTEQPAKLRVRDSKPHVLDEHYYRNTDAFLKDSPTHFEAYDRKGPEIFVGEWAAHETAFPPWDKRAKREQPTPNMWAAIGDAAWMAAMERNSDLVTMQCYAPLFSNVNDFQWRPNLIGYDALQSFGSPSYHAFRMFSRNVGDAILKTTFSPGSTIQGSVTRDGKTGTIYVKLVNPKATAQSLQIEINGMRTLAPTAEVETLAAEAIATNSLTEPRKVFPVSSTLSDVKPVFTYTVAPCSITVLRLRPMTPTPATLHRQSHL